MGEPDHIRELVRRRRERLVRRDRIDRLATSLFFGLLAATVLGFFALLSGLVTPAL